MEQKGDHTLYKLDEVRSAEIVKQEKEPAAFHTVICTDPLCPTSFMVVDEDLAKPCPKCGKKVEALFSFSARQILSVFVDLHRRYRDLSLEMRKAEKV